MTPAARHQAAIEILDAILDQVPAEKALIGWARRSRFAGSGDRAVIRDLVFDALRAMRSCAARGGALTGRGLILGLLRGQGIEPEGIFTGQGHAPAPLSIAEAAAGRPPAAGAEACDIPDWLWPAFTQSLGPKAEDVAHVMQARGPVMLRVNLRRATLAEAQARLAADGIDTRPDPIASTALMVLTGARQVARSAAYETGLVELQDGASQAIMDELDLPRHGKILDYCAGGGGKALAMAARSAARVLAHDAQPARMKDLPARAARAGATITLCDTADVAAAGPFDLVLCDAPCSGSGAWRRAPEGKWALTAARLAELNVIQDAILRQAADLVAPSGVLAYATCSVLHGENEARAEAFLAAHPGWAQIAARRWWPDMAGDGFFLVQFRRL